MTKRLYEPGEDSTNWHDRGCELAPKCLDCPFDKCQQEIIRREQKLRLAERATEVWTLAKQGLTTRQIADKLGIGMKTVQGDLRK